MALTENKIGTYEFVSLNGTLYPPCQLKMPDDRPGVDGTEFILIGKKGRPFYLVSFVDAESFNAAQNLLIDYQDLIEGDAVAVVQGGYSTDSDGYLCSVLSVELAQPIMRLIGAVGNYFNPPSAAGVFVRWELISVPTEE